jgi:hypothetical protein
MGGQVPVCIAQEQGAPQALGSVFVVSYDLQGYDGGILTRLHAGFSRCALI